MAFINLTDEQSAREQYMKVERTEMTLKDATFSGRLCSGWRVDRGRLPRGSPTVGRILVDRMALCWFMGQISKRVGKTRDKIGRVSPTRSWEEQVPLC